MRIQFRIILLLFLPLAANACIWDAQTLWREKHRSHDLAQTILDNQQTPENTNELRATIKTLEANRRENDPVWWNDLAGTYLRLNQPEKAVKVLEPLLQKFPNDYGIHANLGTAYHLLGRYADAEKEIARDLEINPNAHFGLEKYHLALLQYLARDPKYQFRHVYVDEFTPGFLMNLHGGGGHPFFVTYERSYEGKDEAETNGPAEVEAEYESRVKTNGDKYDIAQALISVAEADPPPAYRAKWNLESDPNFEAGVIYMAQLNPKEPACWTMLGIAAWDKRDYHLAVSAFKKAIALGSPQAKLLQERIDGLNEYIAHSRENDPVVLLFTFVVAVSVALLVVFYIFSKIRRWRRARAAAA